MKVKEVRNLLEIYRKTLNVYSSDEKKRKEIGR